MNYKVTAFRIILISPLLALAVFISVVVIDIYRVRTVKPLDIDQALFEQTHKRVSLPAPDNLTRGGHQNETVYFFGESSLVLSNRYTFPRYFKRKDSRIHVVNFGVPGIRSGAIGQMVREALALAKPDVIVMYFGHNDYNYAYHNVIIPRLFPVFNLVLRLGYFFNGGKEEQGVMISSEYFWYARLMRPRLFKLFERLGLFNIRQEQFEPANRLILEHYMANVSAMLDFTSEQGVPVILITPIGNLRAEPFGDIHSTTLHYTNGLKETDYSKACRYLKAARDTEIFTYDIRAKSPLLDYVRSIKRTDVYCLDLEKELESRHFEFGYKNFLDYFHFNDETHRIVADILYDFMVAHGLMKSVQ